MKPLILILLAAVFVQGQSIADIARKEREKRARLSATTRVFTNEDLKSKDSGGVTTAAASPVENSAQAATTATAPAPPPAAEPVIDPVQKWNEETLRLRNKVRDLTDQDIAAQLEINTASAQINAPVTNQSAKNQAQKTLETAQKKQLGIRAELAKTRAESQEKDLQGPPQPKK